MMRGNANLILRQFHCYVQNGWFVLTYTHPYTYTQSLTLYNFISFSYLSKLEIQRVNSTRCLYTQPSDRRQDIMLVHVTREYNVNKIFLSRLGVWPFQSKLVRNLLPIFYLVLEISYYPFEVTYIRADQTSNMMILTCHYRYIMILSCSDSWFFLQILMLYDHRHDAQMIFESCYQLVITSAFIVRLWNRVWNRDKVSFRNNNALSRAIPSIILAMNFSDIDIVVYTISSEFCTKLWMIIGIYSQTN